MVREGAGKEFKAAAAFGLSRDGWIIRSGEHFATLDSDCGSEASCMARGWREFATCHVASQPLASAVFSFPLFAISLVSG